MPFTLAPAFLASPDLAAFDANSLECQSASLVPGLFSFGAMGILALTSLVLAFRLRVARVQVRQRKKLACSHTVQFGIFD